MKKYNISFEYEGNLDIHELLCKVIHEQDLECLEILSNEISDIIDINS